MELHNYAINDLALKTLFEVCKSEILTKKKELTYEQFLNDLEKDQELKTVIETVCKSMEVYARSVWNKYYELRNSEEKLNEALEILKIQKLKSYPNGKTTKEDEVIH